MARHCDPERSGGEAIQKPHAYVPGLLRRPFGAPRNGVARGRIAVLAMTIGVCLLVRGAAAETWPSHPITMGMPFAAGGPGDVLARILAERMRALLGQPVIVENITGAAGSIGTGRVARAAPDGYSLILGNWSTHVVNAAAYALPYDVIADFAPISLVATQPVLLIARKDAPRNDLREVIAWLKANPGKASAGHAGIGSASHVAGVFFQQETGTQLQLVPYRGGAPALEDLLAGQLDLQFDLAANSIPQLRAGTVKAYVAMARSRMGAAPDIPSADEAGVPGLYVSLWNGLWAPRGTPEPVIDRLAAVMKEILADPALRSRLLDLGTEIPPPDQQGPRALAAFQKAEIEKWWPIIKAAGIKGE
jgi:tripartite-type tricarboxylate transporter receptor subunit TctC